MLWLILAQVYTAAHFFIAADFAAVDGGIARRLRLPLASVAERSFFLIPFIAMLPCVLPGRIPAFLRVVVCYAIVMGVVFLPNAILNIGTRSLPVSGAPPRISQVLEAELGFPVAFIGDFRGTRIIYPRSRDGLLIRNALSRHGIEVRP